jgi:hypothetical protein
MHYLDLSRPQTCYRPAFVDRNGKAVCPLLFPTISAYEVGKLNLSINLPSPDAEREFSQKSAQIDQSDLAELIELFLEDPELWIKEMFDYEFIQRDILGIRAPKAEKTKWLEGVKLDDL